MSLFTFALQPGPNNCLSCLAASKQAHPMADWEAAGIYPRSPSPYCAEHCRCEWAEVEGDEVGNLADIPLREQEHTMTHNADNPQEHQEQRTKLAATAQVDDKGEFIIHAITVGEGKGWRFSAAALRPSVKLWDGVNCLVDHVGWLDDHPSVLKLGGVHHSPEWDEAGQAVKVHLRPFGVLGPVVKQLGDEYLAARKAGQAVPTLGFSADIAFTAKGKDVIEIHRVYSLDLVIDPARGGDFIAALQQSGYRPNPGRDVPLEGLHSQESHMKDNSTTSPATTATAPAGTPAQTQLQEQQAEIARLATIQAAQVKLDEQIQAGQALHLQMCSNLLDSELSNARLPKAATDDVRARFTAKVFKPEELTAALDAQRKLVAELHASAVVQGPGRINAMFNSDDQLQAAMDDLFEVERDPQLKGLKVAKLSGIREAYLGFTGDDNFYGAFDVTRARFQQTTATFPGLVKNAMNKAVMEAWEQLGRAGYDWWKSIVSIEHFNDLKQITWLITGTIATLPSVAEGAEYTELQTGDGAETSNFTKYGGYVGLTLEALINDDTRKLRRIPRELGSAAIRNISSLVAAIFTDNSAVGPTMADTGALFNSTAVTTAGGHLNLLTTALTATQWDVVAAAVYNQPLLVRNAAGYYGTGKKMAIEPRFCLVPRALRKTAFDAFLNAWDVTDNKHAENLLKGNVVPLVVPEWTDATDWATDCYPALVPGISIGEAFGLMPEIFIAGGQHSPAVFANDEARIKVRNWNAVGVADFRPLHKNNVA